MDQRQRVAGGRVIGINATEILPDQESRPTGDRQPELHLIAGPRVSRAVGALHAELLPLGVTAQGAVIGQPRMARGGLHLTAPGFAAPVFAALDQIARGSGERIVGPAEPRDAAVP